MADPKNQFTTNTSTKRNYSSKRTNNIIKSTTNTNSDGRTTTPPQHTSSRNTQLLKSCRGPECGGNWEIEGVGGKVGSTIDNIPTLNELVPAITAEVSVGPGNCCRREDGGIRGLPGQTRLDGNDNGFLLECGHCSVKDAGYPSDLCNAHRSKMVSIYCQGRRCEAADDANYERSSGTSGVSTERKTWNGDSTVFSVGTTDRGHSPTDTMQHRVCHRCPHEHGVHHDYVQTRENNASTRPVHATPRIQLPARQRSASAGGKGTHSFNSLDDVVHERQGTRSESNTDGTKEGELGSVLAVPTPGGPHSDGARGCVDFDFASPFEARERLDVSTLFELGHVQFYGRARADATCWPLHVKNHVRILDEARATSMMNSTELGYYTSVRRFFEEPFLATVPSSGESIGQLSQEDVNVLLTAGLIERANPSHLTNSPMLHVFSVPEVTKRRRRLICHTVDINKASLADDLPHCNFDGLDSLLDSLLDDSKGEWHAWTVDIASYYHQFPLDASARKFFRFKVPEIGVFQLCTIPTGQRHCVARAQAFSQFLTRLTLNQANLPLVRCVDVYIDNFLFAFHSKEAASSTREVFTTICNTLGVTLNEFAGPQHLVGLEHRGVVFQTSGTATTAKISSKTQQKLMDALRHINRLPTLADALSIFGVCQYASRIHRLPLFPFYHIYKFIRRRSRLIATSVLSLKEEARIWPSIVGLWERWILEILHTVRTPLLTSCPYHIVSDASNSGWGAVIFPPGGAPFAVAGSWTPVTSTLHINAKELLALTLAATHVPRGEKLKLLLDNTSAIAAISNSRSRSFTLNSLLRNFLPYYEIASVDYVPSANNIADGLSRGHFGTWKIFSNN